MAIDRMLIDNLPLFIQKYVEIQKIMEAEQPEMDLFNGSLNSVWDDQFIQDATEVGVARWEKMLNITPKLTDTLEERKFAILAYMNQRRPYTVTKLKEVLTLLCGSDGFSIVLDPNQYSIEIELALTSANSYAEVEKLLHNMIPANMVQTVQIMYNQHGQLSGMTHLQLSAMTHDQIRNEVLS